MLGFLIGCPLILGLFALCTKRGRISYFTALTAVALQLVGAIYLVVFGSEPVNFPLFSHFGVTLEVTPFGMIFVLLAALMWMISLVASPNYFGETAHQPRYYGSLLLTLSGVTGVFLAADLFTLFVCFEVMSFASYLWVAHNQTADSRTAGDSYLAFGVFGGLSILFGIFLLYGLCPNLAIENLSTIFAPYVGNLQLTVACLFLFFGFGAKAGAFFLHDWLPLAYVQSPAPASALLSGILSKAGVYGIFIIGARILAGWDVFAYFLLTIALLNMLVGGLSALTTSNLKRMLAFSSISQIGFMLWGVALLSLLGEHGAIAAYGTLFHMINHTLIKTLLFLLAGLLLTATGTLDLNQLRGYGKGKPWLQVLFLSGMLSVAGIPGFSGYISKTLLHESVVEYMHLGGASGGFVIFEYQFLLAGGFTLAYMLKLYVCLFVEGTQWPTVPSKQFGEKLSLSLIALWLVVLGALPHLTFDQLGSWAAHSLTVHPMETVHYFSLTNLSGSLISITIGVLLFALNRSLSHGKYSELAGLGDTIQERIYRPGLAVLSLVGALGARICDVSLDFVAFVLSRTAFEPLSIPDSFYHGDENQIKVERPPIHITYSLAYSLLMFGMGFLFTIILLLVLGGRG